MIHVQHYLNHLPLQEREILICVLNKTGVGKSGRRELNGHTSFSLGSASMGVQSECCWSLV